MAHSISLDIMSLINGRLNYMCGQLFKLE